MKKVIGYKELSCYYCNTKMGTGYEMEGWWSEGYMQEGRTVS